MCIGASNLFFGMAASLAFLGIVGALTIDNQLTVIKNDCYERMAIGQRLNPKNVYKSFDYNTVTACQAACTQEQSACKAFSFGIGTKGNATCELSADPIKETADLKPIGTKADTDYDLYIKKMGCSVVIDKTPHNKPPPDDADTSLKPGTLGLYSSDSKPNIDSKPEYGNPQSDGTQSVQNGYKKPPYSSDYNNNHYLPPNRDDVHHVHTLVSVASGPTTYLHPIHEILVGEGPYGYGRPNPDKYHKPGGGCCEKPVRGCCDKGDRPPFRPPSLNHPYDDDRPIHRPRPDDYDRPDTNYDARPGDFRPSSDYGDDRPSRKPYGPVVRPDIDRYDDPKPILGYGDDRPSRKPYGPVVRPDIDLYDDLKPGRPLSDSYDDRPPRRPFRPEPHDYDFRPNSNYDRPLPHRYGSLIPHPDDYNNRPDSYDYVMPETDRYDKRPPKRPYYVPSHPEDEYPSYNYDKPAKPFPNSVYDNTNPTTPQPYLGPSRPADGGYNYDKPVKGKPNRPLDPNDPNDGYAYNKPEGGNQLTLDGDKGSGSKPIVTQSIGSHGEHITSIITEIKEPCFRRVLAGKRVTRRCVKRALTCETVEQCQRECAEEQLFTCEGFNYRIDPTGRGKGDCELLDLPLTQLDIGRDLYPDPDYDYYERDRNSASANCKQRPAGGGGWYGGGYGGGSGGGGYRKYGDAYRGGGSYHSGGSFYYDYNRNGYELDRRHDDFRRPDFKGDRRPADYDIGLRRPGDRWTDDNRFDSRRPIPNLDRRYDYDIRKPNYDDDYRPAGNRRGDFSYHHSHSQQDYENSRHYYDRDRYDYQGDRRYSGIHYLPAHYHKPYYKPDRYDFKSHEPYLPPKRYPERPYEDRYDDKRYYTRDKDRDYWGLNKNSWGSYGGSYGNFGNFNSYNNQHHNRNRYDIDRRNYYLPSRADIPKDWGLYGGSYGNGGGGGYHRHNDYGNKQSYNYWGFYKYEEKHDDKQYYYDYFGDSRPNRKPAGGNYLPLPGPSHQGSYVPVPKPPSSNLPRPIGGSYLPLPAKPSIYESHFGHGSGSISSDHFDNSILPAEPRRPPTYDFIKDECSLRSAAGFRLHKGIVKKFYAVPNIYECELLCFKEREFPCASYAYRYTINLAAPTDNCYLSNRNYKELDHYTDLEPDRDFDIYTMNNKHTCEAPLIRGKDNSDCFWRVRSGQRLDQKVVRDSLTAKSIVDCQVECLRSIRFTCRAFSYRYGSPVIGGVIDNCQLTDWPYYELDPRTDFIPEPGFEVYDRGSFGHGCEPDHFGIRGKHKKDQGTKVDQLCYIGFGSPARLLLQATKKSLWVSTELECKAECSKVREGTLFQCMSFSYRTNGPKTLPNCELSDILQRDLLPNVDYVYDPDSWLFAWDNYSPECIALANEPLHNNIIKETGIEDRHGWDVAHTLNTWRVYSVSGWPCRRGSLCQENREAGFWFCELEGGDKSAWDYCCRPDHQCGASNGYPYQWCYVGPAKTQWRKCSERYYPYVHNIIHRLDHIKPYLPPAQTSPWTPPPYRPGVRPDRPPAPPFEPPPRPSLDEYETQFDNEFLDPPKPGGFGQARHWPVSYLHKEMPPNNTDSEPRLMRMEKEKNPKYAAIQNLINVIRNNDLKNVQYHISNESNKADDILFVKIPLPANFTQESRSQPNSFSSNTSANLEAVYSDEGRNIQTKRSHKSLPLTTTRSFEYNKETNYRDDISRPSPVYRRAFVTRTNVTHGHSMFY